MSVLDEENLQKIKALNNEHVLNLLNEYIEILRPSKVIVITDDDKDIAFVRQHAIDLGEEAKLKMEGHTIHYDSYYDQARDKVNTRTLVTPEQKMSKKINQIDREEGLKEVFALLDGVMEGKEMVVRCFVLGPVDSPFSLCALQFTDSWYVAHSEDILYRTGYEQFKKLNGSDNFFLFVHSAGKLDGNVTSRESIDKGRRIYIDLEGDRVLTVNNQYAGNSLGLKKLALRLALYKANHEDWLAEHMFIMGLVPEGKNRVTYCAGAYPSACGKTSTAMIPGQTIVGDDIAYIRNIDGEARAANIEQGVFGIIRDVNPVDDPVIYKTLTTPRELIFSNVLIKDGEAYWLAMGKELPKSGMNHSGKNWNLGDKDAEGKEINYCHPNARYTVRISELENADEHLHDPEGVRIDGIFYGGRDSDTNVPVFEALTWEHGIFVGATVESETTSATLGKAGVRAHSPMANMDFLVVPLGLYFENHKKFGNALGKNCPKVFATNYFLKVDGKYTNEKVDKKVWMMWAEGRMHGEYDTIKTPVGLLPKHEDLQALFKQIFKKDYTKEEYEIQFSLRVDKLLEKLDRMEKAFKVEPGIPAFFWDILKEQREGLAALKEKHGKDLISPFEL
ncbi:MAG: phosphoenolpyruvate carboxykinase (GTP) [Candidatus Hodarchaeota archaeon]